MLAPISAPPGPVGGREARVGSISPPLMVVTVAAAEGQRSPGPLLGEGKACSCVRRSRASWPLSLTYAVGYDRVQPTVNCRVDPNSRHTVV